MMTAKQINAFYELGRDAAEMAYDIGDTDERPGSAWDVIDPDLGAEVANAAGVELADPADNDALTDLARTVTEAGFEARWAEILKRESDLKARRESRPPTAVPPR